MRLLFQLHIFIIFKYNVINLFSFYSIYGMNMCDGATVTEGLEVAFFFIFRSSEILQEFETDAT